ncbi:MAG: HAD family hydrolase [Janthinobacterium lividum]
MPNVEAILFDFGKVLSLPPRPEAWAQMQQIAGITEAQLEDRYWRSRDDYDEGLLTGDQYWRAIAGDGVTTDALAALKAADVDLWTDMNQPMLAWVGQLHAAGFRTGILSNMPDAMAEGICERFDWIENFDHAVWSHALKLRKPQPAIYAAAIEGLGVAADRILFLDDKEENIAAAHDAGMQAILYSDHDSFAEEMNIRGLADLLNPSKDTATDL